MTYYRGSEASFEEPWCYPNLSMFVANRMMGRKAMEDVVTRRSSSSRWISTASSSRESKQVSSLLDWLLLDPDDCRTRRDWSQNTRHCLLIFLITSSHSGGRRTLQERIRAVPRCLPSVLPSMFATPTSIH